MKHKHHKQYRLPYFNYASSGQYFITICSFNRESVFGEIINEEMRLSIIGGIAKECLLNVPNKYPYVTLDEFVIMPDHIHAIICIDNQSEVRYLTEQKFSLKAKSLSFVVRNYKSTVTMLTRKIHPEYILWQSRFFDRIIRNEHELNSVRKYIHDNPVQWGQKKSQ